MVFLIKLSRVGWSYRLNNAMFYLGVNGEIFKKPVRGLRNWKILNPETKRYVNMSETEFAEFEENLDTTVVKFSIFEMISGLKMLLKFYIEVTLHLNFCVRFWINIVSSRSICTIFSWK